MSISCISCARTRSCFLVALSLALPVLGAEEPPAERAHTLLAEQLAAAMSPTQDTSTVKVDQALELYRQARDQRGEAKALLTRGLLLLAAAKHEAAAADFAEVERLGATLRDPLSTVRSGEAARSVPAHSGTASGAGAGDMAAPRR